MTISINSVTSGVAPSVILNDLSGQEAAQSHSVPAVTAVDNRGGTTAGVNNLAPDVNTVKAQKPVNGEQGAKNTALDKQVQELQDIASLKGWSVNFSVDTELDRTVIKVMDSQTKEVIRQIPSEEWLSTAKKLKAFSEMTDKSHVKSQGDLSGLLLDKQI